MEERVLGSTGLPIAPIVLGTNVFGWTLDEEASFRVLDAFVDHGFNAIDTADVYSYWAPGGFGSSETIIGRWLKSRPGMRGKVAVFTKVGWDYGDVDRRGLSKRWIAEAVDASLSRLGVEAIDLYFSHQPDPTTMHAETLGAHDALLKAGKVKAIGASNFDAAQLKDALATAEAKGLPRYQVLEPEYNLYDRSGFEGALQTAAAEQNLGVITYFSLASGFLSGKYSSKSDLDRSQRAGMLGKYFDARGLAILDALHEVAWIRGAKPAEIALAWLIARPGVTAPIASATSETQVESFAKAALLRLSPEEMAMLDSVGA